MTGQQSGEIRIWSPRRDPNATAYNLYFSTTPGVTPASGTKIVIGLDDGPYHHSGLVPNTTYYYVLTVAHGSNESPPSAEAQATAAGIVRMEYSTSTRIFHPSDTLRDLIVRVTSDFEVTAVTALAAGRTIPLARHPQSDTWSAAFSLADVERGPARVLITVTLGTGATAVSTVAYLRNAAPRLTITAAPEPYTVIGATVRLAMTCEDDDPVGCIGVDVTVNGHGNLLAQGRASLDQTVTIPASYNHQLIQLVFAGTDTLHQVTRDSVPVIVELSPQLVEVARAPAGGTIVDATDDQLLIVDSVNGVPTLATQDRSGGARTTIFSQAGAFICCARLTPAGALFGVTGGTSTTLYEWRNGTLTTLDQVLSVAVAGGYAAWTSGAWGAPATLTRRDLTSATNVIVATDADAGLPGVAVNGDVVYATRPGADIARYRNGVITQLTDDDNSTWLNEKPLTDGSTVVYQKVSPQAAESAIAANSGSGEAIVSPLPLNRSDYRVNNGWIAYARPATAGGPFQAWRRSPAGSESQVSFFSTMSTIFALGPNGELVFGSGTVDLYTSCCRVLYLAIPGSNPQDISNAQFGRPIFIDGQLHVALFNSLFRVN